MAGVPEYWVADVDAKRLHAMNGPQSDGRFIESETFGTDATVTPRFAPEIVVTLAEVFQDMA